jgi:hypothetical protein
MSGLIRDAVKFVRDKAKSRYNKGVECEICKSTEDLDFHHYYSLTPLLDRWLRKKGYKADTNEQVISFRDEFISEHEYELFDATVTLCHHHHHNCLHKIFAKSPGLGTAKKQMNWVKLQKEKHGVV